MLNIVLFEPEIPQNTGNIARTCVAFNAKLHLIKPYGFILNDKKVIRSGLDYWKDLQLFEYDSFNDFINQTNDKDKIYYITRYGVKLPNEFKYNSCKENIYFIFGKESTGIPKQILLNNKEKTIRIPSTDKVRSLNLSNCVAIIAYEALKQSEYYELKNIEPFKPLFK